MKGTQRVRADIVRDTVLDIRVRRREGSQELRKGYNPRAWGYRRRIRMVDRGPRRRGPKAERVQEGPSQKPGGSRRRRGDGPVSHHSGAPSRRTQWVMFELAALTFTTTSVRLNKER